MSDFFFTSRSLPQNHFNGDRLDADCEKYFFNVSKLIPAEIRRKFEKSTLRKYTVAAKNSGRMYFCVAFVRTKFSAEF